MHRSTPLIFLASLVVLLCRAAEPVAPPFSGASALAFTRQVTELGPRPAGSAAHANAQKFILQKLAAFGCQVEQDRFTASSPLGPKQMMNIIVKIPGSSGKIVVVSGHYDTKLTNGSRFVGANDGGSSTGFLLELARSLCRKPAFHQISLVWFDGEEAFESWTDNDSLYGSRHIAARWQKDGTLAKILGLINVDMIGDADLRLVNDYGSTSWLRNLIWNTAREMGHGRHFDTAPGGVTDDHVPFLQLGVAAVDLIDFTYGPGNSYWHTPEDTLDKLSAQSFQVIGDVLLRSLAKLKTQGEK